MNCFIIVVGGGGSDLIDVLAAALISRINLFRPLQYEYPTHHVLSLIEHVSFHNVDGL